LSAPTVLKTDRKTDQGYRTPEYWENSLVSLTAQKDLEAQKIPKEATRRQKKDTLAAFFRNSEVSNALPEPCVRVSRALIIESFGIGYELSI
jgi:hypothetical protein